MNIVKTVFVLFIPLLFLGSCSQPASSSKNEKLRVANEGEVVISYKSIKDQDEHDLIAIFDDNITAFISKESVKLIS